MSYHDCRGRSIGRLVHFLYHYCGSVVADQCKFGNGRVECWGKVLATFTWCERFGERDVPTFTFADWNEMYVYNQETKREQAISDSLAYEMPAMEPVADKAVRVMALAEYRESRLYCEIVHKETPTYHVGERLYVKAAGHIYALLPECGWVIWYKAEKAGTETAA